jgi:hypothetical protein
MLAPLLAVALSGPPDEPPRAPDVPLAPAPPTKIDLPEPRPVPRVTLTEKPRTLYYGAEKPRFIPGFRLAVGLGARLAGDRSDRAHFALDAQLLARVGLHRGRTQAAVFPAFGYGLGAGKVTREHLMVAGLGLGFIDRKDGALALVPSFLFGLAERRRVLGVRTALVIDLFKPGVMFEIAHQYLHLPTGHRHELRLMIGLDLFKLFD